MSDVREAPSGESGPDEPEQGRDKTVRREPAAARKGRCSIHSGEDSVAVCDVCGRALCIACAIPVRGSVVGQECLSEVLEDPPPAPDPPGPPPRARAIALGGFLLVVGSSILPWARYGDASGTLGAWTLHWSLVAVTIGVRLVDGGIGLEAGLTVLIVAPELYLPLRQLGSQFHASDHTETALPRVSWSVPP